MSKILPEQYAEKYVQKKEQERALEALHNLLNDGHDEVELTGITDNYYRQKVVSGLCPMSVLVYYRIAIRRDLPDPEKEVIHCLRCGKKIGEHGVYCSECNNTIKEERNIIRGINIGNGRFFGHKKPKRISEY